VTVDWVASLPGSCLTNLPIGAYTLVGTAGWFSALVATIELTRRSGLAQALEFRRSLDHGIGRNLIFP